MTSAAPSATGGFTWSAFWPVLPWAAGGILLVLAVTYVASLLAHKHSVIDTAWGLLYCAAAIAAFAVSAGHGNDGRRWLLLALTLIWGLRSEERRVGKG